MSQNLPGSTSTTGNDDKQVPIGTAAPDTPTDHHPAHHHADPPPARHSDDAADGETSAPADAAAAPSVWSRALPALALPLFFAIFFPLAYVSALHAPVPNHLEMALSGPAQVTGPLLGSLTGSDPDQFDITLVDDAGAAQALVGDRSVAGAIDVGSAVSVYVASGGGASQSSTIQRIGSTIADQAGLEARVVDVAPVADGDLTATGLFYLTIICTLVGYLTITVLTQAAPDLSLRRRLGVLAGASFIGPVLAFGVMSLFVGAYGATFATIAAVLGIGMLYAFTCGLVTLLVNQLLGPAAIFGVLSLLVLLNFPSAGGAVSPGLLPDFWQVLHTFWVGAGGLEAMHSLVYFEGAQTGRWVAQIVGWTVVSAVLVATAGRTTERRRLAKAPAGTLAAAGAVMS